MAKEVVLAKGKTSLTLGLVDEIIPTEYQGRDLNIDGLIIEIMNYLLEEIVKVEQRVTILAAYKSDNVSDLYAVVRELSNSLSELELNIDRKGVINTIINLVEEGFTIKILEVDDDNIGISNNKSKGE